MGRKSLAPHGPRGGNVVGKVELLDKSLPFHMPNTSMDHTKLEGSSKLIQPAFHLPLTTHTF